MVATMCRHLVPSQTGAAMKTVCLGMAPFQILQLAVSPM